MDNVSKNKPSNKKKLLTETMYFFARIHYIIIKNHVLKTFIKVGKESLFGERSRLCSYVHNSSFVENSQYKFTHTDTQGIGKTGISVNSDRRWRRLSMIWGFFLPLCFPVVSKFSKLNSYFLGH